MAPKKARVSTPQSAEFALTLALPTLTGLPIELLVQILLALVDDYGLLSAVQLSRTCQKLYLAFNHLPIWKRVIDLNNISNRRADNVTFSWLSARLAAKNRALCTKCWVSIPTPACYVEVHEGLPTPLCSECRVALWTAHVGVRSRSYAQPEYRTYFHSGETITRSGALAWLNDSNLLAHPLIPWRRTPSGNIVAPKYWVLEGAWALHGGQAGLDAVAIQKQRMKEKAAERRASGIERMVRGILGQYDPTFVLSMGHLEKIRDCAEAPTILTKGDRIARDIIMEDIVARVKEARFPGITEEQEPLLGLLCKNISYYFTVTINRLSLKHIYAKNTNWASFVQVNQFPKFREFVESNVPYVQRLIQLRQDVLEKTRLPLPFVRAYINQIFSSHYIRYFPVGRPDTDMDFVQRFNRFMTVQSVEDILGMWHFLTQYDSVQSPSRYNHVTVNSLERRTRHVIRSYVSKRTASPGAVFTPLEDSELLYLPTRSRDYARTDLVLHISKRLREDLSEVFQRLIYFAEHPRPKDPPLSTFFAPFSIDVVLRLLKTRALKKAYPRSDINHENAVSIAQSVFRQIYNQWWKDSRWRIVRDQLQRGDFRSVQAMQHDIRPVPPWLYETFEEWRIENLQEAFGVRLGYFLQKNASVTEGPFLPTPYSKETVVDLFRHTEYPHVEALAKYMTDDIFETFALDRSSHWMRTRYCLWYGSRLTNHIAKRGQAPVPIEALGFMHFTDVVEGLGEKLTDMLRTCRNLATFQAKYPAVWAIYDTLSETDTRRLRITRYFTNGCVCSCGMSGLADCSDKLCASCCTELDCPAHE